MSTQEQQKLADDCAGLADLTGQALAWVEDPENAGLVGAETRSLVTNRSLSPIS